MTNFALRVTREVLSSDPTALRQHRLADPASPDLTDELFFTVIDSPQERFACWYADLYPWNGPGAPYQARK